mgnify:CR=1 FL=1
MEVFTGAELSYADVNYIRLYNTLVNLTPGMKLHLGRDWMIGAQVTLPVVNDGYPAADNIVRVTNASVAKQLHFGRQHLKLSGGLFCRDRYGLDLRWMMPVTPWLMLQAQLGYTGAYRLAGAESSEWYSVRVRDPKDGSGYSYDNVEVVTKSTDFGSLDLFTAVAGANVWLSEWNTEGRLSGGRYMNKDYGVQLELYRHFPHVSVGGYLQYHEKSSDRYARHTSGGFKVIMLLPDWKYRYEKFTARLASNFRLTYNAQADDYTMMMYTTDPEENERHYPVRVAWGTGTLQR